MIFRPYPILTICTAASLALLLWLGNWQYSKYTLKMAQKDTPEVWQTLSGTIQGDGEAIIYSYHKGQSAWRRVRPVITDEATFFTTVEIIYSIEPPTACAIVDCAAASEFSEEGVFLKPGRGFGAAREDAANGVFYQYHPNRLAERASVSAPVSEMVFEPRTVTLTERDISQRHPNPLALAGRGSELSPQRHFGYAITWLGLAVALIVMYFAFHRAKGRLSFGRNNE